MKRKVNYYLNALVVHNFICKAPFQISLWLNDSNCFLLSLFMGFFLVFVYLTALHIQGNVNINEPVAVILLKRNSLYISHLVDIVLKHCRNKYIDAQFTIIVVFYWFVKDNLIENQKLLLVMYSTSSIFPPIALTKVKFINQPLHSWNPFFQYLLKYWKNTTIF